MRITDGGPAFPARPRESTTLGVVVCANEGMSLRDWFAGQALAGALAASQEDYDTTADGWARAAYRVADAMLSAREDVK